MMRKEFDWMKIKEKILIFEIKQDQINLWTDLGIYHLQHEEHYSEWLKKQVLQLISITKQFCDDGFSRKVSEKYSLKYSFLRKLAFGISKFQNIHDALTFANGWHGLIGLELAKTQLKLFKKINKKKPFKDDFNGILSAIYRGEWQEYGISKWNDLLNLTFGEINKDYYNYSDKNSLIEIQKKLRLFKDKKGKLPKGTDREMKPISEAIRRGSFADQGIITWNDILKITFGEINKERNKYVGRKGLESAKKVIREFYKKNKKKPTMRSRGMRGIYGAVKRGEWKKFGLKTWNDLLKHVFNCVNKIRNKYNGKKGLNMAIRELKEFEKSNGRLPKTRDMNSISTKIYNGGWLAFGIKSWKDILNLAFMEENKNEIE